MAVLDDRAVIGNELLTLRNLCDFAIEPSDIGVRRRFDH